MKFSVDYSDKPLEVQNEVLYQLYTAFLRWRTDFLNLSIVPATDSRGVVYLCQFDIFEKIQRVLYDVDFSDFNSFVRTLYIHHRSNPCFKLCEEEEVVEEGIDVKNRIYPFRKVVKLIEIQPPKIEDL